MDDLLLEEIHIQIMKDFARAVEISLPKDKLAQILEFITYGCENLEDVVKLKEQYLKSYRKI